MTKNKLSVICILLALSLNSCQQKPVSVNTINANIEPNALKFDSNKKDITVNLPQKLLIIFSDTELFVDPEKGFTRRDIPGVIQIIGENSKIEKTINYSNLGYKIGYNLKLIDNKLLFSEYKSESLNYFSIFNIETEQETKIPINKSDYYISWSHKDHKFSFIAQENNNSYLYVSDLKGNIKKLCQATSKDFEFQNIWSLDDKKIMFSQNDNKDIFIINSDGTDLKNVLHSDSIKFSNLRFSYDNKYISYFSSLNSDTFIINLENDNKQRIGYGSDVTWISDEDKFLFSHHDGASYFLDYIDPENIGKKITLVPDITSLNIKLDINEAFYNSYEGAGIINYKTMERKTFKLDNSFYIDSVSPDGNKYIYIKNEYGNIDNPSYKTYVYFGDVINGTTNNINDYSLNLSEGYNFKWSKDSKLIILEIGDTKTIYSVESKNIIRISDKSIYTLFWLD